MDLRNLKRMLAMTKEGINSQRNEWLIFLTHQLGLQDVKEVDVVGCVYELDASRPRGAQYLDEHHLNAGL
jgi:hypothetical protein